MEEAAAEEAALPTMRASSLAILVGRDWSDWLEELDEKCMRMSSDILTKVVAGGPRPNADSQVFKAENVGSFGLVGTCYTIPQLKNQRSKFSPRRKVELLCVAKQKASFRCTHAV